MCIRDRIGTPFCVTYDFESENDGAVTVRDRDTMEQERIKIDNRMSNFPLYRSGHTVGLFLNKETIYNKHGHEKENKWLSLRT